MNIEFVQHHYFKDIFDCVIDAKKVGIILKDGLNFCTQPGGVNIEQMEQIIIKMKELQGRNNGKNI